MKHFDPYIDMNPKRKAQFKRYEKILDIIIVAFILFIIVAGIRKLIYG